MLPYELGIFVIISKIWEKQTVLDSFIHSIKSMILFKQKMESAHVLHFWYSLMTKKESFSLLKTVTRAIPLPAQSLTDTKPKGLSLFKSNSAEKYVQTKCALDMNINRQDMKNENSLMQLYFQPGMLVHL